LVAIIVSTCSSLRSSAAPKTPKPRVGDHHVDPSQVGEGRRDDPPQLGGVSDVQSPHPQPVPVPGGQVTELLRPAQRRGYPVAAAEQPLGELTAEAAGGPGNEPCRGIGGHSSSIPGPGSIVLGKRSPEQGGGSDGWELR
jgi:hypothetical protein